MNMPDMSKALKELQDAAIVMNGIQSRHIELLKDHAEWLHTHDLAMVLHNEWLQEHDKAMARHDKEMAEARERGRETDKRIADLVVAIGELIVRLPDRQSDRTK